MLVNTQYITLTAANFQLEVLEVQPLVLVDCWASWCGFRQPINHPFNELAIDFSERIKVGRLNVSTSETLATRYGIRAVPTLLLFKDGQLLERVIGSISKQDLTDKLSTLLSGSDSSRRCIA